MGRLKLFLAPNLTVILQQRGFRTDTIVGNPACRSQVCCDQVFETFDHHLEGKKLNRIE